MAKQTEAFIKKNLLSQVNIDTIKRVEYLLRFACGIDESAALVIFQHVRSIKDESISDDFLWVQHLTLMLYFEAKSVKLEAGVGSRLALKYKEEFEALHYYVNNVSESLKASAELNQLNINSDSVSLEVPKAYLQQPVRLERLEVYMHVIKDQQKVRDILKRVDADRLYIGLLSSDTFKEELKELNTTVSNLCFKPALSMVVCVDKKDTTSPDDDDSASTSVSDESDSQDLAKNAIAELSEFCREKSEVRGFGVRVECDIIKTKDDFSKLTQHLAGSAGEYFGILNNDLHGYLGSLSSLIVSLKYIELYNCKLDADDLHTLTNLLPYANRLRELYISGGRFTESAVKQFVEKLSSCPEMKVLELHGTDFNCKIIRHVVKSFFPEMEPASGKVEGQFWLQKHNTDRHHQGRPEISDTFPKM